MKEAAIVRTDRMSSAREHRRCAIARFYWRAGTRAAPRKRLSLRALRARHRRVYHRTLRTIRTRDAQTDVFQSVEMGGGGGGEEGEKRRRRCRAMRSDTVRRKSHYFGIRRDVFMALRRRVLE